MADPLTVLVGPHVSAEGRQEISAVGWSNGRATEVFSYMDTPTFRTYLPRTEVLLGEIRAEEVALAKRLRWVHVWSSGVNGLPLSELARFHIQVTNARGQHADSVADHVFALLLALSRHIPAFVEQQRTRRWELRITTELSGRRMGILGYGQIGRSIAVRARAFGQDVWASRRHPTADPLVSRMFGPSRAALREMLLGCDDVVSVLPLTVETHGLLDREMFGAMRRGARLINVGCGEVIVPEALEEALRDGTLAGAGCDVLPEEPVPWNSPLWTAPNLLITPHVAGMHPHYYQRGLAIFLGNLRRYCRSEPLENVVDLDAGY